MATSDALTIPAAATKDEGSFELLRIWIANRGQHVSLKSGVWEDPFAWGIMLADLAGHIANSFDRQNPTERQEIVERIRAGFDAEMDSPTDQPKGSLIE
jgi:hypothetical protein